MTLDLSKYPQVKRFLVEHPDMDVDIALLWTEKKLSQLKKG